MAYILGIVTFLFGTTLGSFILVITERYNTSLPFFKGRSLCFSCNSKLSRKDLIPIFSFIFLSGRCRYCGSKIPKKALIVEITMGLLSVLAALKSGFLFYDFSSTLHNPHFITHFFQYLIFTSVLAVILMISVYDLKHFIIPDSFLVVLFLFSFIFSIIYNSHLIIHSLFSALILAFPFFLIFLMSKGRWLGFGDIKYMAVIGFALGSGKGLSAIMVAFWIGALVSVAILMFQKLKFGLPFITKRLTIKSEIPFGPFLSLGMTICLLFDLNLFHAF